MDFRKTFEQFIERRRQLKTIYVATCDENGEPNCAPRMLIDIVEPNEIFFIDFRSSQTYANICRTERASVTFMNERNFIGYKLNGVGQAMEPGRELESVKAKWTKIVTAYHAERMIERITKIISHRSPEITLSDDYVFIKFMASKKIEGVTRSGKGLTDQILALQRQVDALKKSVAEHKTGEYDMKVSRDFFQAESAVFEKASLQDGLTGLLNREGFSALAKQKIKIAKRQGKESFLIFSDIDNFKKINDTFGHSAGDRVLVDLARILKKSFRESDIVARIGGDEFAVALTDCGKENLDLVKGHLKKNIEDHNQNSKTASPIELSIGDVSCKPDDPLNFEELLSQADQMMYRQKQSKAGRN